MSKLAMAAGLLYGLASGLACGTAEPFAGRIVNIETREPISIEADGRSVGVTVGAEDTIVRIGNLEFTCRGYRGWLGAVSVDEGSLRVGKLNFRWNADEVGLATRLGWTRIRRGDPARYFVQQDGAFGRNVFR